MLEGPTHKRWKDQRQPIYYARVLSRTENSAKELKEDCRRLNLECEMPDRGGYGIRQEDNIVVISGKRMDSILGVLSKSFTSGLNDQISILELEELMDSAEGTIILWSEEHGSIQDSMSEDGLSRDGYVKFEVGPLKVASLVSKNRGQKQGSWLD